MARGIARRAARCARMIMAMRTAYQRAAAHQARGYEMPQGGMIRDDANAPVLGLRPKGFSTPPLRG